MLTCYTCITRCRPSLNSIHKVYVKRVQTSNEKRCLTKKTGQLELPQKGLKEVGDIQRNKSTSLIHSVQLHNKVD